MGLTFIRVHPTSTMIARYQWGCSHVPYDDLNLQAVTLGKIWAKCVNEQADWCEVGGQQLGK